MTDPESLRQKILALTAEYADEQWRRRPFVPGETPVPVSGRVFDGDDVSRLVDASLDFWLTAGRFASEFEREFARLLGRRAALLVNSGSSANLVALSTLTAEELGDRRLRPGDEVITVAAGFPTTINPILQNRLVPVFLDIELGTYNVVAGRLEEAIGPRTRAIMLAHTLGNPFDLDAVTRVAREKDLWLVEDTCDALGSLYRGRQTGTLGDLS
ncbi:MAG TPA: DegT/DnrJ/EryC1/StrS family aminotransferase, partial [Thermoanaerobaculia bacterium]|nr:DegT/DnrJ/EryC1/StrS family aminotransferase [Thermoanaerobaculia bacterium]